MDFSEHQNLANVIKGVHQKLRQAVISSCDPEKVWAEHLKDYELRKCYSLSMYKLATEIWKDKQSRIEWSYKTCLNYFFNGGLEHSLIRQIKIMETNLQKLNIDKSSFGNIEDFASKNNYKNLNRRLRLLDIGSCYNPFSKFKEFECTAVDLTPATEDVLQFDFLSVEIIPKTKEDLSSNNLNIFLEEKYDIVVLSLVLEYLPTAKQRTIFCCKSWELLQENGLCIIITPDSKSINHNAHMMKSWKLALEKIGFLRVKYEKLQHIHCMAFRKIKKAEICDWNFLSDHLFIPQDFISHAVKKGTAIERTEKENSQICNVFSEFPCEDVFLI